MPNSLNQASVDLIKSFEGWSAKAYPDPATGAEPITIGYGHTTAAGPPSVHMGMTITRELGETILRNDLKKTCATVSGAVKKKINDNQFGALVSLCFNIGQGNFLKSTLLKKINAGDFAGAALQFGVWNRAAGKVMAGLTKRRAAEAALFSKP